MLNQDASLRFDEAYWRQRKKLGPRMVGPLHGSEMLGELVYITFGYSVGLYK